ncbi:hypothetical protein [Flavobacterium sp.]|jgi:hypothetical protein|uniref:hypothetical protein n=1 Tax=Flavobacterium sp. TaxID=239 RepID=UPI0037BF658E
MASLSDWDRDYSSGKRGEEHLDKVLTTHEVKTDYMWQKTGNLFIEYECWYNNEQTWKPSGISVSKAEYYTFVVPLDGKKPMLMSVPMEVLKEAVEKHGIKRDNVNSDNPSKGYLIKIRDLLNVYTGQV